MNGKEKNLVKACLKGKRDAQHQLYEMYKRPMFALCLRYGRSKEDAQDILQNGFVKVFRDLKQYKPIAPLGAWIRMVMVNSALEHIRSNKKRQTTGEFPSRYDVDHYQASFSSQLHAEELIQIIRSIPEEYALVFNMFAIEGYSHKEIAATLDISESNSKVRLNRARGMLQLQIEKHFETN